MASIKIKYRKSKAKGQGGSCFIQLIHRRKMTTIATGIRLDEKEWNAQKSCISFKKATFRRAKELVRLQGQLENIVDELQKIVDGMMGTHVAFTVNMIVEAYKGYRLSQNFFALIEYRIQALEKAGQTRTAQNYRGTLRIFKEFNKEKYLPASELDELLIQEFENYLKQKGNSLNTISYYMRILKAVYNYSVKKGWIKEDRQPFQSVFTGTEKTAKRATDIETLKKLIRLDLSGKPNLDLARDIFLFCIYTRGMSFIDVAHLTRKDITGDIMTYRRHKTHQKMQVTLPECAIRIIEKYASKMGRSEYLFPLLYHSERDKTTAYPTALHTHNSRLGTISKILGLATLLTSYTPRHTWASLAKQSGVETYVISEAMGHTSEGTTHIYLALLNNSILDRANETVLKSIPIFP